MTDPVFETWAEVDAWVRRTAQTADIFEPDVRKRAHAQLDTLATIRRVIAAHSHLREIR